MIIREFEPSDQGAVRSIVLRGLGEHFGFIDETLNPDVDDVVAAYTDQGYVFLVAADGDEIVGTVALATDRERTGRMMRLSVPART